MNDIFFPPQIVQFATNCAIYNQTQVAEYKQLKDTLNRIPSLRKPERAEQQNVTQVTHSPRRDHTAREDLAGEPREVRGVSWYSAMGSLSPSSCHQVNCSKYLQLFLQNSGSPILGYIRVPSRAVKMQIVGP